MFIVTGNHLVTPEFPDVLLFRELGNAFAGFIIPSTVHLLPSSPSDVIIDVRDL